MCRYKGVGKATVGAGLTSVYPVTRPFSPLRTNARLVGGGDGSSVRSEGIDSSSSQYLLRFEYENIQERNISYFCRYGSQ